jgi:hypothetical protein
MAHRQEEIQSVETGPGGGGWGPKVQELLDPDLNLLVCVQRNKGKPV